MQWYRDNSASSSTAAAVIEFLVNSIWFHAVPIDWSTSSNNDSTYWKSYADMKKVSK